MRLADALTAEVERIGGASGEPFPQDPSEIVSEFGPANVARALLGIPPGRSRLPAKGSPERLEYERLRRELSALTRGRRPSREASARVQRFSRTRRGRRTLAANRFQRGSAELSKGATVRLVSGSFIVSNPPAVPRTFGREFYSTPYRRVSGIFNIGAKDMRTILENLGRYRRGIPGSRSAAAEAEAVFITLFLTGYWLNNPEISFEDISEVRMEPRGVL